VLEGFTDCSQISRDVCEKDMNICSAIQKRKSCRAYTRQFVNVEVIRFLLEIAKWAPSGANHQST
jgi:nitroreductase